VKSILYPTEFVVVPQEISVLCRKATPIAFHRFIYFSIKMSFYRPMFSSSLFLFFMSCVATTFVCAQDPSFAPPIDPIPRPATSVRLYLSTAGSAPHVEVPLISYQQTRICPSDYKSGFTLRCEVPASRSSPKAVLWRVRGVSFRKEYFTPYFLAGNWKDRVGSFDGLDEVAKGGKFRVGCQVKGRRNVWVELVKTC